MSRFAQLPIRQKLMAAEAAATLVGVSLMLSFLPYRSWRRALAQSQQAQQPSSKDLAAARQVGRSVAAVARNMPGHPQCLAQALAARAMLKRRGVASRLNLGVNQDRAAINAHAWLSVGQHIVTGGPDVSGFAAFGKQ